MNYIFWLIYYIKCGINILLSRIFNYFKKIETKKIPKSSYYKINDHLYLVRLYGTYKEMGKQYGKLMRPIISKDLNTFSKYIKDNEKLLLRGVNPIIKKKLNKDCIFEACYQMYLHCIYFIPGELLDFLKGMSESSGIEYNKLVSINFFMEVVENHCILYTRKTRDNFLVLRTLDFCCPLISQSLIVFNPTNKYSYCSLSASFMFGSATMISKNLLLGESFCDYNLGEDDRKGIPFYFLFHKIMSEAKDIHIAEDIMKKTKRIGNLEIMISDFNLEESKIFEYSPLILNSIEILKKNKSKVIYSVSPNEKPKFEKYKNTFNNAKEAIEKMLPLVKSGELHVLIYDNDNIYVAVTQDYLQSYNTDFLKLPMKVLIP